MSSVGLSMAPALFACSKCFSRHPFEELSQGQQLCKVNSFNAHLKKIMKEKDALFSLLFSLRSAVALSPSSNVPTAGRNSSRKGKFMKMPMSLVFPGQGHDRIQCHISESALSVSVNLPRPPSARSASRT